MTIDAGTRLGRYEIRSKIGEGGMGEVYLAEDTRLHRKVALKVLPAEVASNQDRMRRFNQEAQAAAALNHPNIAHIYEIGESQGTHFIAMEFIDGVTLRDKIHHDKAPLAKLLKYLTQVAEGLAKTHSAGIVHRDLKPDNIMITRDDYAKILDFGLAKLIETPMSLGETSSEVDTALMPHHSLPGRVIGTVGYMSPEQAQGKTSEIDHRSDIFSFGCILFEAATRRRAFGGKDALDSLHKIVHAPTPQVKDFSENAPDDLQRIVRRCLAKEPDRRYHSIKDVAIELEELQQELKGRAEDKYSVQPTSKSDATSTKIVSAETAPQVSISQTPATGQAFDPSVPASTRQIASPSTSSAQYIVSEIRRHKRGVVLGLALLFLVFVGIAYGLIEILRRNQTFQTKVKTSSQAMKLTRLTENGKATAAAISPDGNYVAYAVEEAGKQSLRLRQVASPSEKEIVPAAPVYIKGPTFSQDGNLIYYTASDRENLFSNGVLYQVSALGGTPRKVMSRVASPISFSPDGGRIAFVRDNESAGEGDALMVANVDGTGEQVLAQHKGLAFLVESGPAWSPDGKTIACGAELDPIYNTVIEVLVEDRTEKPITSYKGWTGVVERVAWLRDGSGLIVVAAPDVTTGSQIWHLSYPSGEVRRITNDLNSYGTHSLSLTADSGTLVAVQEDSTKNIWVTALNEDSSRARQITNGKFDGGGGLSWSPDGKIVYATRIGDIRDLWIMNQDGTGQGRLTADAPWEAYPRFSSDGRYLVFNSDRASKSDGPSISHIWRLDADGSNPKQLTSGNAENYSPVFTPDGQWVLFASWRSGKLATWKVSADGGEPMQLARQTSPWPAVSPDGKLFACGYHDEDLRSAWRLAVYPIEGGQPIKLFDITSTVEFNTGLWWTPDGRALVYVDTRDGVSNVWSKPIDDGPPKQLTNFKSDLIFKFALSSDGRQFALARGARARDVVLIRDFK